MTTSAPAAPLDVRGLQEPRVHAVPPFVASSGAEAVELAQLAGLHLDPWEELVLANSLNERADGRWAAFEVGLAVPRQNGKGSILEARELAGLFLLGEKLLIHSAHEQKTASEHFLRLLNLIESVPEFEQRVLRAPRGKGAEAIELRNGQRIFFKTRTGGGGRGLSGDFVALDEAMILPVTTVGALMPTLSARSITGNPQLWYAGSAVDQQIHEHGLVFARIRERGFKGDDPSLMYAEWSVDAKNPDAVTGAQANDPTAWAQSNPGLGIRISAEHIGNERRSMDHRTFCTERLGVGDWPRTDGLGAAVIDPDQWEALADPASRRTGPVCFAFDITPDRSSSSIAVAGRRADGLAHVEIVQQARGTGWLAERVAKLKADHPECVGVICDASGPAGSLLAELKAVGIEPITVNSTEHGQACGVIFDAVEQKTLRHLGTPELLAAVKGAVKRPLGDAWAWSRRSSATDISPIVAVTLALWGFGSNGPKRAPRLVNLDDF